MASPNEKLAASLTALRRLQKNGRRVFQSQKLTRVHRERLLRNGFLQEVIKGWVISSSPGARQGDSTPWYASFWEFCARYCAERFKQNWHLSPELSLFLHAEKTDIPTEVVIYSSKGANHKVPLLFGTCLYDLKQPQMPAAADIVQRDGLRVFAPAAAIIRVPEIFFATNPIETRIVLASFRDASELLRRLLDGGRTVVAGRIAGALRHIGRPEFADEIIGTMKAAGYYVRESNPFAERAPAMAASPMAPIVGRIQVMWESMRGTVLDMFPRPPGLPRDTVGYLKFVDDIYSADAYHSLSIEGYSVSLELIDRAMAGNWDPDRHDDDRQSRDALAARGYWQAFQAVKANVGGIIGGANAGALVRNAHREWYRELFQPCVAAGLLPPGALAGYRNDAVYLRTSRYVPPRWEAVRDAMPALFDLLEREPAPAVRAVLGHWLVGYIHPYPDGNGRIARFLMNAMLASGGYPWTVVRVEDRNAYLAALDRASIDADIRPFAAFLAERVNWSLDQAARSLRQPVRGRGTKVVLKRR
jgi:fido (protein-threonine AMPylation protein)